MIAVITAIDQKAGTVTVNAAEFYRVLKQSCNDFAFSFYQDVPEGFYGRGIADVLKKPYADDALANIGRDFHRATDQMLALRRTPGTLSGPAVVALTTLCAMEWLRHRKAAVTEAEASGDYSTLMAEFIAWLRALFATWRAALEVPVASSAPQPASSRATRRVASRARLRRQQRRAPRAPSERATRLLDDVVGAVAGRSSLDRQAVVHDGEPDERDALDRGER